MDEHIPASPPLPASPPGGLLQSRKSRRAFLGGAAGIAAAGTAAAIIYASGSSGGGGDDDGAAQPASNGKSDVPPAASSATSTVVLAKTIIADPRRRAAHLLRRAGFGGTTKEIEEFSNLSREAAADRLINFEAIDNSALNGRIETANFELADYQGGLFVDMQRWWLTRMAYTARPLEERMTYIWHGLLTSQVSKIGNQRAKLMVRQNDLFRGMALPKYDVLLKAVSRDPAMLLYLDNVESTKEHPNENYARELMELFSMGVGNYSEDDVRESARAFTGWRITAPERMAMTPGQALSEEERRRLQREGALAFNPQFYIAERQHDNGSKTFLGQTGNLGGDEIIDIIMKQPATGRFMCTRLFQEFVRYEPDKPTIEALVKTWESSGFDVKAVVRQILVSDAFYSEASYRSFVRSPVEFAVNLVRALELETDFRTAVNRQYGFPAMDQVLFEPPSVAGWPGGSTWLSSSTFFGRANFADGLFFGFTQGNQNRPNQNQNQKQNRNVQRIIPVPALATAASAELMVDAALDRLVDGNVTPAARDTLYAYARSITKADERAAAIAYLVAASPEYQLA